MVIFAMTPSCTHAISSIYLCGGVLKMLNESIGFFSVKYMCEDTCVRIQPCDGLMRNKLLLAGSFSSHHQD